MRKISTLLLLLGSAGLGRIRLPGTGNASLRHSVHVYCVRFLFFFMMVLLTVVKWKILFQKIKYKQ